MLANYLIGLREGLEAGLIVGILVAYVRKVGRTDVLPRLWVGIGIAILASLGVGAALTWGPYGLSFAAQEALGGGLSLVAVAMVTWMIFWMASHARGLKHELQSRLDTALAGAGIGIVLIGTLSVGREGVETALFVWATVNSTGSAALGTAGALLGLLTAAGLSWLLARGVVRINLGRFFTWTGAFLVVIVAGVFAYGIGDLQEAGLLPGGGSAAFSLAAVVPPSSWYGSLLAGIFNFTPEPTWAQVAGWIAYLLVVGGLFAARLHVRRAPVPARRHNPAGSPA
ncbi:iron uptake transporter permease EfeU [Naasia aerilata]|uniref:Iron transporter n=1 Tax=Naasia aerilata TaxID=1162966 RepID=A0ABM8G8V5_9MICO|nr:iron uptake transporter permease EfeU [Naasia aerilata]BDZ44600.1 iron transporter [Naasia aerilata]